MIDYKIVPLISSHTKQDFDCGQPLLDNYLHRQANQDAKRKLSVCFVQANSDSRVLGYYTLSNASLHRDLIPEAIRKKLPQSYIDLPATLLGRLAVDKSVAGKGLGGLLLIDALKKTFEIATNKIGSLAVIVDPIDSQAVIFNEKYGFIRLPDSGKMFLPMATISQLFSQ